MRGILIVFGLVGLLLLTALLYVAVALRPLPAIDIGKEEVRISASGEARQGDVLVGRAESTKDGSLLHIALALPSEQGFVSGSLSFTFSGTDAREKVAAKVVSIQGESPFRLVWETGNQLRVRLISANEEGFPALMLTAPEGYFSIPPLNLFAERVVRAPIWYWIVSSFILLMTSAVIIRWRTRPMRWEATGERPTPPGDMRPLELAMLHHSTLQPSDIAAFLFDLADRGHLQIIARSAEDILFLRSRNEDGLSTYEKNFLLMLFPESEQAVSLEGITSTLNEDLFSAVVSQFYVDVNDGFTNRGFFRDSPRLVHLRYKTAGIIIQVAGLVGAVLSYWVANQTIPGLVVLCVAIYGMGMLLYSAGANVVPLSRLGEELVRHCAEFKNYLTSRESFLINESGQQFYTYLPHAVVLGVAQPWMNRFIEHVQWYIPQWYTSLESDVARADQFVNQVGVIARQIADVMVALKDPNVD